jgi:hypothetical protein
MRFLFRPPAAEAAGLLSLPWERPLEEWDESLLRHVPQRGISRHVVRFVANDGQVYALKEIAEPLARHEYAVLGDFEAEGMPTVSVLGICVDRPDDQPAILVTRYLEYSMSYRYLFSSPRTDHSAAQLIDTLVVLLVRLHLDGVFWGDCSLSNTLFRPDAGAMAAHLVDAETVERHPQLSRGQRGFDAGDVELVTEDDGFRLRVGTRVSQPGLHRRELFRLTGLEASENQARRLLNDLRSHRAHLESEEGAPVSEPVAGQRWTAEEYQPVVDAVPPHLVGRLAPAEVFHEVLEHRWFLSEAAGRDVGTAVAARSYLETVLPQTPPEVTTPSAVLGLV